MYSCRCSTQAAGCTRANSGEPLHLYNEKPCWQCPSSLGFADSNRQAHIATLLVCVAPEFAVRIRSLQAGAAHLIQLGVLLSRQQCHDELRRAVVFNRSEPQCGIKSRSGATVSSNNGLASQMQPLCIKNNHCTFDAVISRSN